MKFIEVYRERKLNDTDPMVRADQFFALTLYECKDDYSAPFLLKKECGNPQAEDWDMSWEIMEVQNRNQAIREVIKRIDSHIFKPSLACGECICTSKTRCAECKDQDMFIPK